jgi:hypothetical protein
MTASGTERTRAAPPGSTVVERIPDSPFRLTSGGAVCKRMVSNESETSQTASVADRPKYHERMGRIVPGKDARRDAGQDARAVTRGSPFSGVKRPRSGRASTSTHDPHRTCERATFPLGATTYGAYVHIVQCPGFIAVWANSRCSNSSSVSSGGRGQVRPDETARLRLSWIVLRAQSPGRSHRRGAAAALNLRRYAPLGRCRPKSRPSKVKGWVLKAVV